MKGVIQKINKREVAGWIINENNSKPITVNLEVNGKVIDQQKADLYIAKLKNKKKHKTGKCGFSFNIKGKAIDIFNDKISITAAHTIGVSPELKNLLARKARLEVLERRKVFFFIHIPKTAGTSFRNMLYQQFKQVKIYPNEAAIKNNAGKYPVGDKLTIGFYKNLPELELFTGHYPYNAGHKLLLNHMVPFVFLRDPIERTISFLHHSKRLDPSSKNKTLIEIFKSQPHQVQNVQTYFLTGAKKPQEVDKKHLKVAKARLNAMKAFGITEHFDESIAKIEKAFGWDLGKSVKMNRNPKPKSEIDPKLLRLIKDANAFDLKLYKYAKKKFHSSK